MQVARSGRPAVRDRIRWPDLRLPPGRLTRPARVRHSHCRPRRTLVGWPGGVAQSPVTRLLSSPVARSHGRSAANGVAVAGAVLAGQPAGDVLLALAGTQVAFGLVGGPARGIHAGADCGAASAVSPGPGGATRGARWHRQGLGRPGPGVPAAKRIRRGQRGVPAMDAGSAVGDELIRPDLTGPAECSR
jgi:hypothetical protein